MCFSSKDLASVFQVEVLFELIKGLIKDLDGTPVDEVHVRSLSSWVLIVNFPNFIHSFTCLLS